MLPQPPPDAKAPPPSETALRSRRYRRWIWVTGVVSVVLLPVFFFAWSDYRRGVSHGRGRIRTEAVNNARQIGFALFEFEIEYGRFPDATTITAVQKETGTLLPLGTKTSNDYFRQLIGAGITQSEPMFYARIEGSRKPDGLMDPANTLVKGNVGFAYLAGLASMGSPSRPLVVTPLIPGTDRFDPKPFDGKAVILKMDNSVTSIPIQKDGHVLLSGRNILDPGHPIWDGKPPVIVWPE